MNKNYQRVFKRLAEVSKAIHNGENCSEILESIVMHTKDSLAAGGAIFWIIDDVARSVNSMVSHCDGYCDVADLEYDALNSLFVPHGRTVVHIEDVSADERLKELHFRTSETTSLTGVSVDIIDNYRGILVVWGRMAEVLHESEQDLLIAFAEQGALALHKTLRLDSKMQESLRQMVEGFALALEAKDEMTHGHSMQVARYARMVAVELGLAASAREAVYHGGLLHDIGKIGLDDVILERLGILSRKERNVIREHPVIGARIVRPLTFMSDVLPIILHHHERYDGTGYPDGLKGEAIPLGARIVTACDALETMLFGRKHLRKLPLAETIAGLQRGAGHQFDPKVVAALFAIIDRCPEEFGPSLNSPPSLRIQRQKLKSPATVLPSVYI